MKKHLLMLGGALVAAFVITGCAGITTNNGGVAPISAGPNFFTEVSANAMIQPATNLKYTVVKRDVQAKNLEVKVHGDNILLCDLHSGEAVKIGELKKGDV